MVGERWCVFRGKSFRFRDQKAEALFAPAGQRKISSNWCRQVRDLEGSIPLRKDAERQNRAGKSWERSKASRPPSFLETSILTRFPEVLPLPFFQDNVANSSLRTYVEVRSDMNISIRLERSRPLAFPRFQVWCFPPHDSHLPPSLLSPFSPSLPSSSRRWSLFRELARLRRRLSKPRPRLRSRTRLSSQCPTTPSSSESLLPLPLDATVRRLIFA